MSKHVAEPRTEVVLPSARVANNKAVLLLGFFVLLGIAGWALYRVYLHFSVGYTPVLWPVFVVSFVGFTVQQILAYCDRVKLGGLPDHHNVEVLASVFNEDPAMVRQNLRALLAQTRRPNSIHITDDGSDDPEANYDSVRAWFLGECDRLGVIGTWEKTDNRGKRHGQVAGMHRSSGSATIHVTVDSDSTLDRRAIEEGLKPFDDPEVMSVAGAVVALRSTLNLLSRVTDVLFVAWQQLSDRSSLSAVGSVLVNSGGLAFYRAEILRDNWEAYLSETFTGKPVSFSDDSLLTLFALQRGKTVQQRSAIVFCAMPEDLPHHVSQQVRWFRGSFIRSLWRIRYLPVVSWGFARQVFGWVQLALTTVASVALFVVYPVMYHQIAPEAILVPVAMAYAQGLRYFSFVRSDISRWQHFVNFLLIPLAWVWQFTVLRYLRFYGMVTCWKIRWNTRGKIHVFADVQSTVALPDVSAQLEPAPIVSIVSRRDTTEHDRGERVAE